MEENKQLTNTWRDVQLTPEMSVYLLVDFLNVLNQRLSLLEDVIKINDENGNEISITEYYKRTSTQETPNTEVTAEKHYELLRRQNTTRTLSLCKQCY